MHGIIDNLEIRHVNALTGARSNINDPSAIIDMAPYESVAFIAPINASAATGVATLKVQENDSANSAGMSDVSGAVATATSLANSDLNEKLLIVEIRHPAKRYVRAHLQSRTANINFGAMIAVLKPRRRPAQQGETVLAKAFVSN